MFPILRDESHRCDKPASCAGTARHKLRLLAVLLACGLTACASKPADKSTDLHDKPAAVAQSATDNTALQLLQRAESAASPEREQLLMQVAALYQNAGDADRASRALAEIQPGRLAGDALLRYSLLYGATALDKRQLLVADTVLQDNRLNALAANLNAADSARLHGLRARLFEAEQRPLDALNERLAQSPLLTDEASQRDNSDAIWTLLSQLREEEFQWLETQPQNQTLNGWLALAHIQRQGLDNIEQQAAALQDWQHSWPVHPANRFMPADMKLLRKLLDDQPRHIALLLPLSGKRAAAGRAVRDGFLAGYYRTLAASTGNPDVQIDLIDSSANPDILASYHAAVAQGAELVIGPLEREQVQVLAQQTELPVPTLALNNPPAPGNAPDKLFQFSLNPEDEVRQVAEAAWANRAQRAVVMTPEGERGERLRQAFLRKWELLGGSVTADIRYQPDGGNYGVQIADALGIDLATGQYREGSQLPDMIYFVGNSSDAAAVVQNLARNNAPQVAVYSSSQLLSASTSLGRNKPANGVRLCLTPWQVGQGPLRSTGDKPPAEMEMLYAMGADAQQLYLRLPLMQANASLHVPGNTGYLYLDRDRHVARKLVPAVIQDGQPQPMPVLGSDQP